MKSVLYDDTDILYRDTLFVESGTSDDKINRALEKAFKNAAKVYSWPKYEWIKHKVVSRYARPDIDYYIIEVIEVKDEQCKDAKS